MQFSLTMWPVIIEECVLTQQLNSAVFKGQTFCKMIYEVVLLNYSIAPLTFIAKYEKILKEKKGGGVPLKSVDSLTFEEKVVQMRRQGDKLRALCYF